MKKASLLPPPVPLPMRWPLRVQILLPTALLMLAVLAGVSGLNAWLSLRYQHGQMRQRIEDVAATLAAAHFPLRDPVLRQAAALAGAELVVTGEGGQVVAASDRLHAAALPAGIGGEGEAGLPFREPVTAAGTSWLYGTTPLDRRPVGGPLLELHVFYPADTWHADRRRAILPPLMVGAAALVVVVLLAGVIARRVTRPVERLRRQVEQIAHGDFTPMPLPAADDELRSLAAATNRMADMLARYEQQVRRSEQLRTLGQLGGGIAHQMRNAVTGCRMALDFFRRESPQAAGDDNLDVALRQLALMETHLQRFLTLGRESREPLLPVDLAALVRETLPLVDARARHVGVRLRAILPPSPTGATVPGHADELQQVLVNLLLNAIEAAGGRPDARVTVRVRETGDAAEPAPTPPAAGGEHAPSVRLEVCDNGPGPEASIADALFEPLVTGRPDGIGLGLAVVRQIVEQHGGSVRFERQEGETRFVVELAAAPQEVPDGAAAGR